MNGNKSLHGVRNLPYSSGLAESGESPVTQFANDDERRKSAEMATPVKRKSVLGRGMAPLLGGAALAIGLLVHPDVGNAFSSGFDSRPVSLAARGGIGSFTPASVDPQLAARISVASLNHGQLFRFTPAAGRNGQRAVTVAVRVDAESARAVSVRQTLAAASVQPGIAAVRVAPTAFNLGSARGYESFAPRLVKTVVPEIKSIDMPDLAAFKPGKGGDRMGASQSGQGSRFAPRIALDETAKPGRAPRTLEGQGDYSVDVGGSYRVTRNVAVTAGVRYSSERDRVRPLTDTAQDNQAVYVGPQFRF
jgi:hypothetical protein